MLNTASAETTLIESNGRRERVVASSTPMQENVPVNGLQTAASTPHASDAARTVYHIYHEKNCYKRIQCHINLELESPRSAVRRAARKGKQEVEPSTVREAEAFFLHKPYLAFHGPPQVLYAGEDKHAPPAVLIHGSVFWRRYKLQYGSSLAADVLDPRGVVAWKHNGGTREELRADDTKLKGYKVRTWRLWGETGKTYVRQVKATREQGIGLDPDMHPSKHNQSAQANGVVCLRWEHPFSRQTRQYHFRYGDIDFYWKGTSAVKKPGFCGFFVRWNHLKLVATIPAKDGMNQVANEVCLGKYTSSVSKKKCGRLELYNNVILQLVEDHMQPATMSHGHEREEVLSAKKTWLYRVIVATATCMIAAEKEKREAVGEWLEHAGEGGG